MASVTVTYRAPEGDSPFVEWQGVRFFDGQAVALDERAHAGLIAKANGNPHFEVSGATKAVLKALAPEIKEGVAASVEDDDMAFLVKEAESLGIKIDGRWSRARLEAEISTAKIAKAG